MAEAAEYGLMLWDGKSKGTVINVVNLSRDHKPVVVYVAPQGNFAPSSPLTTFRGGCPREAWRGRTSTRCELRLAGPE